VNLKWFVKTGPFAAIIAIYRLIPAEKRKDWNNDVSTSHEAMDAVLAPDGGRKAFVKYATPQLATRRRYGFFVTWVLFLLVPRLRTGQSWAN